VARWEDVERPDEVDLLCDLDPMIPVRRGFIPSEIRLAQWARKMEDRIMLATYSAINLYDELTVRILNGDEAAMSDARVCITADQAAAEMEE
jgi:hypothetical protein